MQKLLKYWQKKLDLMDWHIVLRDNCPITDFTIQNAEGETEWQTVHKCAVIRIIREEEYGTRILPFYKEQVLIHELLHIKFAVLWDNNTDIQNDLLHQQIESLAKTLYEVHKENLLKEDK